MATRVEVLLAEIATKVEYFAEEQRELRKEIKDNMATVEDVEMVRINYITADAELSKTLAELKKVLGEEYVTKTTAKWVLIVALLVLALALKVDLTSILPSFFKAVVP